MTRLAEEQAAVRRVATLVARQAPQADVFSAIAEEVGHLLAVDDVRVVRYEDGDGETGAVVVASWGILKDVLKFGERYPLGGRNVTTEAQRTGLPARLDEYGAAGGDIGERARAGGVRSAVAIPITVEGETWGAITAAALADGPLPADIDSRLVEFTQLMSTAIANTEARAEVQRLADEQAALHRVATLVAEGVAPTAVFNAVVEEVGQLFGSAQVGLSRFEPSNEILIVAIRGQNPDVLHSGMRLPVDGDSVTARVLRTGRSARLNLDTQGTGRIAETARRNNSKATIGAPVVVEGTVWGVLIATWNDQDFPPTGSEERLAEFAELIDIAIANAASRDQLIASRARVLTAGDEARRRLVRDLHDGAQQRLVHTIISLKLAQRALENRDESAAPLIAEALEHAERAHVEVRELAHGILPSVLTRGGLRAGLDALVPRLGLPVEIHVSDDRLPSDIEASAYFIVAEALTNAVKHSEGNRAEVTAVVRDGMLSLEVTDDGVGGADPRGHGLVGVADRVAALRGRLRIDSPKGAGTVVAAELPLPVSGGRGGMVQAVPPEEKGTT